MGGVSAGLRTVPRRMIGQHVAKPLLKKVRAVRHKFDVHAVTPSPKSGIGQSVFFEIQEWRTLRWVPAKAGTKRNRVRG